MSAELSEAYLPDAITKIAEGHPISRIDKLMPWTESYV